MKKTTAFFAAALMLSSFHQLKAQDTALFFNPAQPTDKRISNLISKLTITEKASQMVHGSAAIPRLNIVAYNWWNECLHGVARSGTATVFPQAIGIGATFDADLVSRIGTAISDEARAMYNASVKNDYRKQYGGLTFWTPNINIFRDPRWGRGQETYGEDPVLTATLGVSLVKALQGDDPKYLKVAACAKHFAVHSGPERLRHQFNAVVSPKDLNETYLPAFKALVDAKVEAVMCAYNRTNDQPCCGSSPLLKELLRDKWNFQGHIVTDCGAITDFDEGHKVTQTPVESAALALKNGVNLNCGSTYAKLPEAVTQGLITEKEIDESLAVLLKTRFKLGLFDPSDTNPYNSIPVSVINCEKHRKLAYEAALKSAVLLKNDKNVLPLRNDLSYIYVTGPNAASVDVLLGNYYGVNDKLVTFLEGFASRIAPGSQLQYKPGCLLDRPNVNPIDWTTGDAKSADATIVVLGISGYIEGEEGESIASEHYGDRLDYNIPANQIDFLKKLRKKNKKPIIAVITGGSPMNLAEVHELSDAILLTWYPGEEGGNAIADLVFGNASPSGRLPVTFPKSLDQLPPYENYAMEGRTYRYMKAEPMYPFGFGLSYSSFAYSNLSLSSLAVKKGEALNAQLSLTNNGKMTADEVVELYFKSMDTTQHAPLLSLKSFKRLSLKPGETTTVKFTLTPDMMKLVNDKGESVLMSGKYKLFVGGSQPGKRSEELGASKCLEAEFEIK